MLMPRLLPRPIKLESLGLQSKHPYIFKAFFMIQSTAKIWNHGSKFTVNILGNFHQVVYIDHSEYVFQANRRFFNLKKLKRARLLSTLFVPHLQKYNPLLRTVHIWI